MSQWKIEMRDTCKICGKPLPNARYRTFCSKKCREKSNNLKMKQSGYSSEYQRKMNDKIASIPSPDKVQCLICGRWYVQVCSHVWQRHGIRAREYREMFGLDVKKGITPKWYKELKGQQAIKNDTYKNLEAGVKFRFKKGSKIAGRYKRSPETIERLKNLHKFNKVN